MTRKDLVLHTRQLDAVVFDMDGVVTRTAGVHAAAWKALFDAYLEGRSARTGEPFRAFDTAADYLTYVDGKPRYDGVRDFLGSRGIHLPEGAPGDAPAAETVSGLGNRKNDYFLEAVRRQGVLPYQGTIRFIARLHAAGIRTAVISASENTTMILEAAGVRDLFAAQVDGRIARDLGIPGKPAPDVFLEAARRVGAPPARAVVVEDALAGVTAGRAGGFALVVGVDRTAPQPDPGDHTPYGCALPDLPDRRSVGVVAETTPCAAPCSDHCRALLDNGADVVVRDLGEIGVAP